MSDPAGTATAPKSAIDRPETPLTPQGRERQLNHQLAHRRAGPKGGRRPAVSAGEPDWDRNAEEAIKAAKAYYTRITSLSDEEVTELARALTAYLESEHPAPEKIYSLRQFQSSGISVSKQTYQQDWAQSQLKEQLLQQEWEARTDFYARFKSYGLMFIRTSGGRFSCQGRWPKRTEFEKTVDTTSGQYTQPQLGEGWAQEDWIPTISAEHVNWVTFDGYLWTPDSHVEWGPKSGKAGS